MTQHDSEPPIAKLLQEQEEWLMERILNYAQQTGFTAYTSTLKEAWRLSISGLTTSIILALENFQSTPDLTPGFHFDDDPVSQFGIIEAQKHRKRGISLAMFFSLFKYYRQAYLDLIEEKAPRQFDKKSASLFINRVFDIIEIAFSVEWSGSDEERNVRQLQMLNREMTNEKNKYLTIFESLPSPVIIANTDGTIDNLNLMATSYFNPESGSGAYYYHNSKNVDDSAVSSESPKGSVQTLDSLLPWLAEEFRLYIEKKLDKPKFIKHVEIYKKEYSFVIRFSELYDVSRKFTGIVIIFEDITRLERFEKDVNTLAGFIPICSHCKRMRDDQGYWTRLEQFIQERSDALFSHSICESCMEEHYGDLDNE